MNSTATASSPDYAALAPRVGEILAALAALIARAFLRRPQLAGLIVPLWQYLTHIAPRLARALTHPPRPRPATPRPRQPATKAAKPRLPNGRGWLVRELGYEGAAYMSQLQHLLSEPAMRAALDAVPAAQRVLRGVCRMLGVTNLPPRQPAPVAAPAVGGAPPVAEVPGEVDAPGRVVFWG